MSFIRPQTFTIAVILLLSACAGGRKYDRPGLALPSHYAPLEADAPRAELLPWSAFFNDPVLKEYIDTALRENFDMQIALRNISIAQSYVKQAKAALLPSVDAQVAVTTNNPSGNSLNGISLENFVGTDHLEDYTLSAGLTWELDIWGKIRQQKESALADYLQRFEAARAIQTTLVAAVAESYYALIALNKQLDIARTNAGLSDSTVTLMKLQKDAGEVTELAVQQAVAQQLSARLLIPQLLQSIEIERNRFLLLSGSMPSVSVDTEEMDEPFADDLITGVPADLLRNRPDVKASEQALISANARVGVAQTAMYPTLTLTASGGLNAFKASNWFNTPASLFGIASGGITQPLFQRRALRTQLEVARAEREQRVIEFRQRVATAVHEVTNQLASLEHLAHQQEIAGNRVQTLDQAVRNSQLLFRSGMANYIEVIAAQNLVLEAELDQAVIEQQFRQARIRLYQALGGGWQQ